MGDGLLVYFGFLRAHENEAGRAVRAGLEIVEGMAGLAQRAIEFWRRAAQRSVERSALGEALRSLDEALAPLDRLPGGGAARPARARRGSRNAVAPSSTTGRLPGASTKPSGPTSSAAHGRPRASRAAATRKGSAAWKARWSSGRYGRTTRCPQGSMSSRTPSMDRLAAMRAFAEIVDRGSLTAAAEALERSPPTMVRTLAALEKHLGARLLPRNPAHVPHRGGP